MTRASVVIPAFNEASVLDRCLTALAEELDRPGGGPVDLEVTVVANGCTDSTADVARGHRERLPRLLVLEREQPGKIGALNAGDEGTMSFPRIYLDADVVLADGALKGLIGLLSTSEAMVAAPAIAFDTEGTSWPVRSFFRVFTLMPYVNDGLIGLGVYGASAAGRARFGAFPDVTADDLFVQQLFAPAERRTSPGRFVIRVPRRLAALVAVRSRGAKGKDELAALAVSPHPLHDSSTSATRALIRIVRHNPTLLGDVLVYVAVSLAARRRARRGSDRWARDDSTRAVDVTRDGKRS